MPTRIAEHTVPWPAPDAARYVAEGYWPEYPSATALAGRPTLRPKRQHWWTPNPVCGWATANFCSAPTPARSAFASWA